VAGGSFSAVEGDVSYGCHKYIFSLYKIFPFVKPTLVRQVQQIFFLYETPQFIVTPLVCVMNQRHHSHCPALFVLRPILLRSKVLSAVNINFTAFWDVAHCILIDMYQVRRNPLFPFSGYWSVQCLQSAVRCD
jgi:hypothetical protein